MRLALIVADACLPLIALYLLKLLIDTVSEQSSAASPDVQRTTMLVGAAALVTLLSVVARWFGDFVGAVQRQSLSDYMQDVLQRKSMTVDLSFFENAKDHDRLHRALVEGPSRPGRIFESLVQLAHSSLSLLLIGGMVFALSPWIIGVVFVSSLPAAYVQLRYSSLLHAWQKRTTERSRMASYLHAIAVQADEAKEARTLGFGAIVRQRFRKIRRDLLSEREVILRRRAIAGIAGQGLATCVVFGCYAVIAQRALVGAISIGDLVLYYEVFRRGQDAVRGTLGGIAQLYEDDLYISNLFEFLDLEPGLKPPARPRALPPRIHQGLRLERVSFSYPQHPRMVLVDLNLRLDPGEHVALVGENGSGKTTLVKLLARLYDPTGGTISLDGIDIREFDPQAYRSTIGVLFQHPIRYQLSANENIQFAGGDDSAVREAASLAGVAELIEGLPQGYETLLGRWFDRGVELSIGEWQKVALARALAGDPKILLLDEPTSAFGPKAESEMIETFRKITEGKATLTISHRLSVAKLADRILVLDQGKIAENGSHEALIEKQGIYARMFRAQSRQYG